MSKLYEIVIFTAAGQEYADSIIDGIEGLSQYVDHRLYWDHVAIQQVTNSGVHYFKDLSLLGRELDQVLIVDNLPQNFGMQPENGIFIKEWKGDRSDTELYQLSKLL